VVQLASGVEGVEGWNPVVELYLEQHRETILEWFDWLAAWHHLGCQS
jgi:hypothetical protein